MLGRIEILDRLADADFAPRDWDVRFHFVWRIPANKPDGFALWCRFPELFLLKGISASEGRS